MVGQTLNYTVVDAFTETPFSGNPAAVVVLPPNLSYNSIPLQSIAREFNLSETAFVSQRPEGHFDLKWFTPTREVPLCGHATLAAAHVLFSAKAGQFLPQNSNLITFHTLSGPLTAVKTESGKVEIELPAGIASPLPEGMESEVRDVLKRALGSADAEVLHVGTGSGSTYGIYLLVELSSEFDLENAKIQVGVLEELKTHTIVTFTVRCSSEGVRFKSRTFAPKEGIDEDPVCGSAHCFVTPYWTRRLGKRPLEAMMARQVSERGGDLEVMFDESKGTCKLRGHAIVVAQGEMFL